MYIRVRTYGWSSGNRIWETKGRYLMTRLVVMLPGFSSWLPDPEFKVRMQIIPGGLFSLLFLAHIDGPFAIYDIMGNACFEIYELKFFLSRKFLLAVQSGFHSSCAGLMFVAFSGVNL
jgi:hypothetical protein